ncbi:MAG: hypothetical protein ACOYON_13040 [Fimbriimonas sp.]
MSTCSKAAIGVFAALSLWGCGGSSAAPEVTKAVAEPARVQAPSLSARSSVALIRHSGRLRVGDTFGTGFEVFPAPARSFEFTQLPERFGRPYSARGWQAVHEGFGMVAYSGIVVAGVYQVSGAKPDILYELLAAQETSLKGVNSSMVASSRARYWFWEVPGFDGSQPATTADGSETRHRVMICALQTKAGLNITVAMGDAVVLDALGMSQVKARQNTAAVDTPSPSPLEPRGGG